MSTTETLPDIPDTSPSIKPGFPAQDKTLEYLTNPSTISTFLHKYQELTDEAFEEIVNDIGYRAALMVLRAKALREDVRALDLYIRICREDKERRRERGKPAIRSVYTSGFTQDGRNTTTKEVDPTTKVVNETSE